MSFDRLKMFLPSLRFRLTLWNSLVILALLVANLAAIRAGMSFTLARMVDEFLNEELDSAVLDFNRLGGEPGSVHSCL